MKQRLFSVRWAASIVLASLSLFILPSQRFVEAAPLNNQVAAPGFASTILAGTNANPDYYFSCYGVCTYYTDQAKDIVQNDTPVWHVNSGSQNGWGGETYIGMKSPFDMVAFKMSTWGGSPDVPTYEYLQGVQNGKEIWAAIPTLSTVGNHFRTPTADKIAKISFAIPLDWQKAKFNSIDAYWIRMKATNATVIPKADYVSVRTYNVKTKLTIHEKTGSLVSTNTVFNNVPAVGNGPDSPADCPGALLNEYNAGAGFHYYALRTDAYQCSVLLKLKDGYFQYGDRGYGKLWVSGKFTTDLTDVGELEFIPFIRVAVQDEDGKAVPNAKVTFNGGAPAFVDAVSEKDPNMSDYFFIPKVLNGYNEVFVSRPGYAPVPSGPLAGFGDWTNSQLKQVRQYYAQSVEIVLKKGVKPCQANENMPNPLYCSPLARNSFVSVLEKVGNTFVKVPNAKVEVFTDKYLGSNKIADDVSKEGPADAVAQTNDDGYVSFALPSGKYFLRVSKVGYGHAFAEFSPGFPGIVELKKDAGDETAFDYVLKSVSLNGSPELYIDKTEVAKNTELSDLEAPVSFAAQGVSENTYLYLGLRSPFDVITYQTAGWLKIKPTYEYFTANGFKSLSLKPGAVNQNHLLAPKDGVDGTVDGRVSATFAVPQDWTTKKVNGNDAYWVRVKFSGDAHPSFDRLSTKNPFNVKVQFRKAKIGNQADVVYGPYDGKVYVSSPSAEMLPCNIIRDVQMPDGIHLYSVKFQSKQVYGNETCQLSFRLSPSVPDTSGFTYAVRDLMGSSTPGFYDLTTDEKQVYFSYRVAVRVEDEMGNKLTNAKVTYDNKPPLGQLKGQGMIGTYVFTPKNLNVPRAVRVVANGYVTEDGQGSHTGLKQVAPGSKKETIVYFSGTDNHECDQPIKDGVAATCGQLRRDLTVRVTHKGAPVEQADVKIYTSAVKNKLGNDLSKNVIGFPDKDAQGKTDVNGLSKAAMATGQYWIQASKAGFKSKTVVAKVTTGIVNTVIIELEEGAETPTCLSPLGLQIPCVPPPTTGDCLDTSKPCTPTSTIPTECRNALGQIVPCVPPPTGDDCADTSKPCTPTSTIPTICRNALGQIVPCPGSVPQICKDTAGNVIPCPGSVPKVCKDTAGNVIPCPTDSTPKLSSVEVGVVGTSTLTTGQSVPLFAYAHFTDGSKKDIGFECAWSLSNNTLGLIQNVKFISLSGVGIDVVTCTYAKDGIQKSGDLPITIQLDPSLQPSTGGTSGGGRTSPSTH